MADDSQNEESRDEAAVTRRSSTAYAAGLAIFFSVASFLGLGWLLDSYFGTGPWLIITGILLGSVAGFYQFIRIMSRNNN
ncbi:MAG TPA: AtpZ/AtpI family protein [Pyrinomonadaceae bacterium]